MIPPAPSLTKAMNEQEKKTVPLWTPMSDAERLDASRADFATSVGSNPGVAALGQGSELRSALNKVAYETHFVALKPHTSKLRLR